MRELECLTLFTWLTAPYLEVLAAVKPGSYEAQLVDGRRRQLWFDARPKTLSGKPQSFLPMWKVSVRMPAIARLRY